MATQEEAINVLYRKYINDPIKRDAIENLARQHGITIERIEIPEETGMLDYLLGAGEMAATFGAGMITEPISGLVGIGAGIVPGEPGQAARAVEWVQERGYQPRTRGGKAVARGLGQVLGPFGEAAEYVTNKIGDIAFKLGGPFAGAGAKTAIAAIPEILGLKGTKSAKKAALGRMVKEADVTNLYDELGNLLPDIRKSIEDSGLSVEEVKEIIPPKLPEEQMVTTIEQIRKAKETGRFTAPKKLGELVEEIKPSKEIIEAAEEMGFADRLLASHYSENPIFRDIEQGLKSIPGSQLAAREKALISDLAKEADNIIVEFGGEIDKSALSDRFRNESMGIIKSLEDTAEKTYDRVNTAIPKGLQVDAENITGMLDQVASELGGKQYLEPKERKLLKDLGPKANPTYARLDKYRKQIGKALRNMESPFSSSEEGTLKRLYGALAEDQQAIADAQGVGDMYRVANDLWANKKTIEKQLTKVLDKELTGTVMPKAKQAMLGLQRGETKAFDTLVENIPERLDPGTRKSIFATALNDAFVQGSRKERSLNIPGFDDFMVGMNRNPAAKKRLTKEIGPEAMRRLETFHKVINGIRRAKASEITTGRIAAVPKMFEEVNNITSRLFGVAEKATSVIPYPGKGAINAIKDMLDAPKNKRSMAAEEFLSSPKFQSILKKKATGRLEATEKIAQAENAIEKLESYKRWKETLPERDLTDLAAVGVLGYLTGETIREEGETNE